MQRLALLGGIYTDEMNGDFALWQLLQMSNY